MPRGLSSRPPSYRLKLIRGRRIAVLTLRDSFTRQERELWLGPYDAPESRERYLRELASWEKLGRRLLPRSEAIHASSGPTVAQVCLKFKLEAGPTIAAREWGHYKATMRVLLDLHGSTPAIGFGPNAFRLVRDEMARVGGKKGPWSRKHVNSCATRIRRIFKWAVSHELLPVQVHESLKTVEPLRRGQAREGRKVVSVSIEHVNATTPFVSPQVAAMIELQLVTGMRPGECCIMRPIDIDTTGGVWTYRPSQHKGEHFDKDRIVFLGPKGRAVVERFITGRATDAYMFSPREAPRPAEKGRRRRPGQPPTPRQTPRSLREHYTTASYRRAIEYACTRAGIPRWHPHQLRHTAATVIRKHFGLEAAQVILGHGSAAVTDAIYAERDMNKAREVAAVIG